MGFLKDLVGDYGGLIGGGIGAVFGGPWGAAIGGSIGGGLSSAISGDKMNDAQMQAQREAMQIYQQNIDRARGELGALFPAASEMLGGGYQSAFDLTKQGFNPQMAALTQGNQSAQQTLMNAMPQMQNAILGGPIDYSAFSAPSNVNVDTSFLSSATMPSAIDISSLLGGMQTPNAAQPMPIGRANPPMGVVDPYLQNERAK